VEKWNSSQHGVHDPCDHLDPPVARTGVKDTGKGVALSAIGYEDLTRPESYHLREAI
jgi:hypothetical protein